MRKTGVIPLVALFALSMLAQTPNPATDVSNADIRAFLKALPRDKVSDLPIRVVDVGGYQVGIFAVLRPKSVPGDAILHQTKRTEIYQILDGLVEQRKRPAPFEDSLRRLIVRRLELLALFA